MGSMKRIHAVLVAVSLTACSDDGRRHGSSASPAGCASPARSNQGKGPKASSAPVASGAPTPGGKKAPNILLVLADDQRADSVACMPKVRKEVAEKGVTFSHYFASTPLCCPARTTMMTGLYAHNHGVKTNGDLDDAEGEEIQGEPGAVQFMEKGNEQRVVAKYLQDAGYLTGHFGKYLNGYDKVLKKSTYVPPYWNEWHAYAHPEFYDFTLVEQGKAFPKPKKTCFLTDTDGGKKKEKREKKCAHDADEIVDDGKENYATDIIAGRAVDFVRDAHTQGKPFFAYVAVKAPHGPFTSPRRYQPDPKKAEFTDEAIKRLGTCDLFDRKNAPPSVLEADVTDKPKWVQELVGKADQKEIDFRRKQQLMSVLATEDALDAILKALDETGERENTIILYAGDNGFSWGEHHYLTKNCAYEECERVPLVIYDPRAPQTGERQSDALVADIDVAPTLLELAGIPWPSASKLNGASLGALLRDAKAPWTRDEILIECWGSDKPAHPPIMAGVRTSKWKYIVQYADGEMTKAKESKGSVPVTELYDLEKDPYELDNILAIPGTARSGKGYTADGIDKTVKELEGRLGKLLKQ